MWKGREKIQKFEYLKNEESFLDEIKNVFHRFRRPIIWRKKTDLIKIVDASFKWVSVVKCFKVGVNMLVIKCPQVATVEKILVESLSQLGDISIEIRVKVGLSLLRKLLPN